MKKKLDIAPTIRSSARLRTEQMLADIRNGIIAGDRPIGSFLPSLLDLCSSYQLSKNTVRKGLEQLVEEGIIENIPRIGAKVISQVSAETVTIRFGYYATLIKEVKILQLIEKFEQKYPHIHVVPVRLPDKSKDGGIIINDLLPTLDVLTINLLDYGGLSEPEKLFETNAVREDTYSFLQPPFMSDKELFVQPFIFSPIILCYNKEHFKQSKVPEPNSSWTWKDLQRNGRALFEPLNRYGLFFHAPSENRWPIFLIQNGFSFQNNKTDMNLSDPKFKQGIELYSQLIQDEQLFPPYFSENDDDVEALFLNQKVSMIVVSYMRLNAFQNADFDYDISPVPYFKDPKTLVVIIGLALVKQSHNKNAAKTLIDFLLSDEIQLLIRKETLSIPANATAAEWNGKEVIRNRPSRFSMYREIIPTFYTYQALQASPETLFAISDELKAYWSKMDAFNTVLARIEHKLSKKM